MVSDELHRHVLQQIREEFHNKSNAHNPVNVPQVQVNSTQKRICAGWRLFGKGWYTLRENSSEGFRKAVHQEILTIEFETVTKRLKRVA